MTIKDRYSILIVVVSVFDRASVDFVKLDHVQTYFEIGGLCGCHTEGDWSR